MASLFSRGALLLIDKPSGMTSHDVVERVRKITGVDKIGHTGTLDPMATGLLPLCCGRAARLQAFFTGLPKSYEGVIALGRATDTYDQEGQATSEHPGPVIVSAPQVDEVAALFRGEFDQAPPPYSAKKVGGKKLYELARRGQSVDAGSKKVNVTRFDVRLEDSKVHFALSCSSGTYVRSIAHELGQKLGCGAHLAQLRRTEIGPFQVRDAVGLKAFEEMDEAARMGLPHSLPLSRVPLPFPRMALAALEASRVRQGQPVPARIAGQAGDWICLTDGDGEVLAFGQISPIGTGKISMVKPKIVLAN